MNLYENKYNLRTSDFNQNAQLTPTAVLDLFQDAAGKHATVLGVSSWDLMKKKLMWVVMRTKFEIIKNPPMHSTVKVQTWPHKPSRAVCQRDYAIYHEDELIIKGTSEWLILNIDTRKMVSASDIYPEMEFKTDKMFDTKLIKLPDFDTPDFLGKAKAHYSDIDLNGHVNNAKYANYVANVLQNPEKIKTFEIHYHREVMCGDGLDIKVLQNKNEYIVKAQKEDEAMFSCKIVFDA